MTMDERDAAAMNRRAEDIEALFVELDKEVAAVRARYVVSLEEELHKANRAGDLKTERKINLKIAAVFAAASLNGEAERYRFAAEECRNRLARRTWVENHKQGRHKR